MWCLGDLEAEKIVYRDRRVPSWSWMAYTGPTTFWSRDSTIEDRYWGRSFPIPKFDDMREDALIVQVRNFLRPCPIWRYRSTTPEKLRGSTTRLFQLDPQETVEDVDRLRCVPLVRYQEGCVWTLLIRPTEVEGEYVRIGCGTVRLSDIYGAPVDARLV